MWIRSYFTFIIRQDGYILNSQWQKGAEGGDTQGHEPKSNPGSWQGLSLWRWATYKVGSVYTFFIGILTSIY